MERLENVFVTDAFPQHTYVAAEEGKAEKELKDGLAVANKIISIVGPSKCGKTTLCNKIFGTEKGIENLFTSGDQFDSIDEFWDLLLEQSPSADRLEAGAPRAKIIEALAEEQIPVIIDDYHYTTAEVRHRLCQQMKNAAAQGLRFIVLNTPHRGNDPIRNNPDLAGRFFTIDMDFWTLENLAEIGIRGFAKLGVGVNHGILYNLAAQSLGSPQIMQTLCLEMGREHLNEDLPYESQTIYDFDWPAVQQRAVRSYDLSHTLTILKNGPQRRGEPRIKYKLKNGKEGDVYEVLAYVLALDPPVAALEIEEIRRRAAQILLEKSSPNFPAALDQINTLFSGKERPVEYVDHQRTIFILDPHFHFYLRTEAARLGLV